MSQIRCSHTQIRVFSPTVKHESSEIPAAFVVTLLPWTSDILTTSLKHKYQRKPVITQSVTEWEINLCLQRCAPHAQGILIKQIWKLFLLQGKIFFIYQTLLLYVKCFDKTTALCPLKAPFIDTSSSTCCVRSKLQSYFSSCLLILETYWKIRETRETPEERDVVSTLQSSVAWAEVPAGPCPHLDRISSPPLSQTYPWALSQGEQNYTELRLHKKQWLKPTILTPKIQISHHFLLICRDFAGLYFGDSDCMKPG